MQSIESSSKFVASTHRPRPLAAGRLALGGLALLSAALTAPATALGQGSSSAYGTSVNLSLKPPLLPAVSIISAAAPTASGTAPPPYADNDSVASITVAPVLLGTIVSTGVIDVAASSSVPNGPTTSASATVDDST